MNDCSPPYSITDEMLIMVSEISELLGRLNAVSDLTKHPKLRRSNRIKSIQSSLAIENNSLSLEQVSDILDGKHILGPPDEIQEVKNAIDAYRLLEDIDPFNLDDLLKAHKAMTNGMIDESGAFRKGAEGVFSNERCIHMAPPPDMVPILMTDLFNWLGNSNAHPLITSSVFHYELEFIHPFRDGNGRMGRFWQTAILMKWKPIFAWIPTESMIYERQQEYYDAIAASTEDGSSNRFIVFMLKAILDSIKELTEEGNAPESSDQYVKRLMAVTTTDPKSAAELMEMLGLRSKATFQKNYLKPALEAGLVKMTLPDKPTSRNQRYFKG